MTSARIPPLLAPYIILPQLSSLTLVTGILGATTNWLMLRFLAVALMDLGRDDSHKAHGKPVGDAWEQEEDDVRVVLLSFTRDWDFWRREGLGTGIDFVRYSKSGRVTFIDGLSELFTNRNTPPTTKSDGKSGHRSLNDPNLDVVESTVLDAIEHSKNQNPFQQRNRTLLFLDGLDFYIAATGQTPQQVNDMIEEWREHVYATIIATATDSPLLQSPITPLETAHTAFVAGLAHEAGLVMSVRGLDTGVARDISGVIRIAKASGWTKTTKDAKASTTSQAEALEDRELLFFVGGEGGLRLWERGA